MNRITGLLPHLARILLGLPFFVGGLNGFLEFAPMPELTEPAAAFMGALVQTGYLLPLVKAIELLTGLPSGRGDARGVAASGSVEERVVRALSAMADAHGGPASDGGQRDRH